MKALLISIRPQWVELILNFIKKDEIRKGTAIGKAINKLIKEQGVAPTFIYCTKARPYLTRGVRGDVYPSCVSSQGIVSHHLNSRVVARFNATAEEINATNLEEFAKDSCLTVRELENYLWSNILSGTAIHINDLEIFDKPKEISEFSIKVFPHRKDNLMTRYLTRAPQSWCYIEV